MRALNHRKRLGLVVSLLALGCSGKGGTPTDEEASAAESSALITDEKIDTSACTSVPDERRFAQAAYFSRYQPLKIADSRYAERGVVMAGGIDASDTPLRDVWLLDLTNANAYKTCPWVQLKSMSSGVWGGQMIYRQAADQFQLIGGYRGTSKQFASDADIYRANLESTLMAGETFTKWTSLAINIAPTYAVVDGACSESLTSNAAYLTVDGMRSCTMTYDACDYGGDVEDYSKKTCPDAVATALAAGSTSFNWYNACAAAPECGGEARQYAPSTKGQGLALFGLAYLPSDDVALLVGGVTGCEGTCGTYDGLFPTKFGMSPDYSAGKGRALVSSNKMYKLTFDGAVTVTDYGINLADIYNSTIDSNATVGLYGASATALGTSWSLSTRAISSPSTSPTVIIRGGTRHQTIPHEYTNEVQKVSLKCCMPEESTSLGDVYDCTKKKNSEDDYQYACSRYEMNFVNKVTYASADEGVVASKDALVKFHASTLSNVATATDPRWGTAIVTAEGEVATDDVVHYLGGRDSSGGKDARVHETDFSTSQIVGDMGASRDGSNLFFDPFEGHLLAIGGRASAMGVTIETRRQSVSPRARGTLTVDSADVAFTYGDDGKWTHKQTSEITHTCTGTNCLSTSIEISLRNTNDKTVASAATLEVTYPAIGLSTKLTIMEGDWTCGTYCHTEFRLPRALGNGDAISLKASYAPTATEGDLSTARFAADQTSDGDALIELRAPLGVGAIDAPIKFATSFKLPPDYMGFAPGIADSATAPTSYASSTKGERQAHYAAVVARNMAYVRTLSTDGLDTGTTAVHLYRNASLSTDSDLDSYLNDRSGQAISFSVAKVAGMVGPFASEELHLLYSPKWEVGVGGLRLTGATLIDATERYVSASEHELAHDWINYGSSSVGWFVEGMPTLVEKSNVDKTSKLPDCASESDATCQVAEESSTSNTPLLEVYQSVLAATLRWQGDITQTACSPKWHTESTMAKYYGSAVALHQAMLTRQYTAGELTSANTWAAYRAAWQAHRFSPMTEPEIETLIDSGIRTSSSKPSFAGERLGADEAHACPGIPLLAMVKQKRMTSTGPTAPSGSFGTPTLVESIALDQVQSAYGMSEFSYVPVRVRCALNDKAYPSAKIAGCAATALGDSSGTVLTLARTVMPWTVPSKFSPGQFARINYSQLDPSTREKNFYWCMGGKDGACGTDSDADGYSVVEEMLTCDSTASGDSDSLTNPSADEGASSTVDLDCNGFTLTKLTF